MNDRLWSVVRDELIEQRLALGVAASSLGAAVACDLLAPWPLKIVVDHVLLAHPLPPHLQWLAPLLAAGPAAALAVLAAAIALLALASGALNYLQLFLSARAGHHIVHAVRRALFGHLATLPLAFHTRARTGELITRVAADTMLIRDAFSDWALRIVSQALLVAGLLVVMLAMNWRLGLVVAVTLPLLFVVLRGLGRRIRLSAREQRHRDAELAARLNDALSAMQLIQAFGRTRQEQRLFEADSERSRDAGVVNARASGAVSRTVGLTAAIATAGTVLLGGSFVLRGTMTPGDLLIFVAYVGALFKPIRDLGKLWTKLARARVGAERLAELLAIEPARADEPDAVDPGTLRGHISFRQVRFGYASGAPVLAGVDAEIAAGEHVAIIGPSGSGKSTMLRLLLRLCEPQAGTILIDGRPLRHYTLEALRRDIGVVLQESVFMGATIGENVAYGRPEATRAEIEDAARLAGVHDFIAGLAEGYDTVVGERGSRLSGGQRQRICLARTLVRDPAILVLDEPTSAVDPESAAAIERTLREHRRGRTTLVIGHQFGDFAHFDRVLELRDGSIRELGPRPSPARAGATAPQVLLAGAR